MPPRGLAASRKAKANKRDEPEKDDPKSSALAATDEAALTIEDLFELRQTALDIIAWDKYADKAEEARGLLRGILHGCESLQNLPEDHELRESLGLTRDDALVRIEYLQAFALCNLGLLLIRQDPPSVVVSGSKRRKLDPREPTTPEGWIDEALPRYESAYTAAKGALKTVIGFDYAACRLAVAARVQELAATAEAIEAAEKLLLVDVETDGMINGPETALCTMVPLLETINREGIEKHIDPLHHLTLLTTHLEKNEHHFDTNSPLWRIVQCELRSAVFIAQEDAIEAKYRPDADPLDTPDLPDEEDVRAAEKSGRAAAQYIRESIQAIPKDWEYREICKAGMQFDLRMTLSLLVALMNEDRSGENEELEKEIEALEEAMQ